MHRAISATVKNRVHFGHGVRQALAHWRRRHVQRRAYREFRATHSHCTELYFDKHFLFGRGAEALAHRDAEALAYAWTRQFCYRDERHRARDVRRLEPQAESLLELLDV